MENANISRLQLQDKEIILLGTAHVSSQSAEEVRAFIEEEKPDAICIELDEDRYQNLLNPERWLQTDISDIIRKKQTFLLLSNIILSAYQRRMADKFDTSAGKEMVTAIEEAGKYNIPLVLADRSIKTTFKRIWAKHSLKEKAKILAALLSTDEAEQNITAEDIEALKNSDMLEAALKEVSKEFPTVYEVLVDERNRYLAEKIRNAPGKKILAVIGAAHRSGIIEAMDQKQDLRELESVPEKSAVQKLRLWIVPALLFALILFSFTKGSAEGFAQLKKWILINGSFSAFACLLCLAHPLTILTAFVAAPITSLNPLLAAGWFAGLTEAFVRKPKVSDFQSIYDDVTHLRTFLKNRVLRILLIVILTNLLNSLATFISGFDIIANLFG